MRRTVLPLIAGGPVHVGSALQAGLQPVDDAQLDADLLVARAERLTVFCTTPLGLPFDETCWALARALGNTMALLHPEIGRRVRLDIVKQIDQDLAEVEPPVDADDQLRRLTLGWRLYSLTRRDVRVRHWAGEQRFQGQAIPRRLLWWQGVRRVHQETTEVRVADELREGEGAGVLAALTKQIPLAAVYHPKLVSPDVLWDGLPAVLGSPRLMRLVLARLGDAGLDRSLGQLATVVVGRLQRKGIRARDRISVRFFGHALCTWVLAQSLAGGAATDGAADVLRARFELDFGKSDTLWQIAAVFAAAYRCGLAAPFDLTGDAAEKVKLLYDVTAAYAGEPRVRQLVTPLREVFDSP